MVVTDEQGSPVTKLDGMLVPPGQLLTDDEAPGQIVATSVVGGQYLLFVKAAAIASRPNGQLRLQSKSRYASGFAPAEDRRS